MNPLVRVRLIKRHLFTFCSIALLLSFCLPARSQTDTSKPVYVAYTYIKTFPGKFDTYDSLLKKYSQKIMENEITSGNFMGWATYELIMPEGTQTNYDVLTVSVSNKIELLLDPPGTASEMFAKNFPDMSESQRSDVMKKYGESRDIVKREIYSPLSSTMNGPPSMSKYVEIDYMTPVRGKEEQYVKMETGTFKAIHAQRIALGALKGWILLAKLLPADSKDPAPFITANFYDNLDGIMDGKYTQAGKKAFPTMDMNKTFQSISTVKKDQRNELWKLVNSYGMDKK